MINVKDIFRNCLRKAKYISLKIGDVIVKVVKNININNLKISGVEIGISRHGNSTIFVVLGITVVSFFAFGLGFVTTSLLFFLIITMYFFRDPVRVLPKRKNVVVSPCDGIVLKICPSLLPEELNLNDKNEYTKISTFMNITDMHIQRMPVDCIVRRIEYIKGTFINASFDKASKDNERNIVLVEGKNGDTLCIVQIAGFVARRIVCTVGKDEVCKVGEKYGMIKFGSRIELYIPKSYNVEISVGQRLVCGETVVANFNYEKNSGDSGNNGNNNGNGNVNGSGINSNDGYIE